MYVPSPVRMWRERGRRGAWARFSCIEPGRKSILLQFWIDGLYSKKGYKFQQKFERNIERLRNTFTANGRNNNLAKIFLLCAFRFYVKMSSFHKSKNDCALYEIMEMIIFWGNKYEDETFVVCIKALCIFLTLGESHGHARGKNIKLTLACSLTSFQHLSVGPLSIEVDTLRFSLCFCCFRTLWRGADGC